MTIHLLDSSIMYLSCRRYDLSYLIGPLIKLNLRRDIGKIVCVFKCISRLTLDLVLSFMKGPRLLNFVI